MVAWAGLSGCGAAERSFDEGRAFRHLEAQVAFGPRVPGSEAHGACLAYLRAQLEGSADEVTVHTFEGSCAVDSSSATFHNVIAVFRPESRRRILFGAHWDTRSAAERDPDPAKRNEPVPGANDGASGVAVLLEVAAALAARPPETGVDLVFFDGEDCGVDRSVESWALGAQAFVRDHPDYRPGYAVILDMVGRRGTRIPREGNSAASAPQLVAAIWAVAREEGLTVLADTLGAPVMDDHIPFLAARIPAVDLIDLDDPAWHTTGDLPANCAPESLGQLGRLVLALVERAEKAAEGGGRGAFTP
jgi:Zn-dependent M28 family amino/carboxypeptidase